MALWEFTGAGRSEISSVEKYPELFVLSRHDRDALTARLAALGWRTAGARRAAGLEQRLLAARAGVMIVDLRGEGRARSLAASVAEAARVAGAALVALIDESQQAEAEAISESGAGHFLLDGEDDAAWRRTLLGALATARRLRGEDMAPVTPGVRTEGQDYLTGLMDRRAAIDWLETRLKRGEGISHAVLLGLSQYESINAAYGVMVGDALLARVAGRIGRAVADAGGGVPLLARIGGADYLLLLEGATGEQALMLARRLLAEVARPFPLGEQPARLTARCGVAGALPGDDAARLLRRASAALGDARRSSSSDIAIRSADRRGRGVDSDRLDADLRFAIDRGEIAVVFQPQYACADDTVVGVEALARWNHPQLGQLDAALLFGAADRSDFLLPLSRHIQQRALREAALWPAALDGLRLSINVTAADLAQQDFLSAIRGMILDSGFPPQRLTVEITESGLIENIRHAGELLRALRDMGIGVAIDDFGTGYSSLAYLKALHPDYLKLDSSLTRDIVGDARDRTILRGIIAMARSLALAVIAEGVENERQLAALTREGCAVYQGFLRSRPLHSGALAKLIETETRH